MAQGVKRALVIIDMQAEFTAARDPDLCARITSAALCFDGHVLEVRTDGSSESTLDLSVPILWKKEDDGGQEVYSYLLGAGLVARDMEVFVCGVNAAACVYNTTCGLTYRLYEEHGITNRTSIVLGLCGDDNSRFRFVQELP